MALGGHPGGVQPDQFAGDFLDGLARLGLGAGPVRAAHLAEHRRITADIPCHLVQLIGGDKQPVPWRAALGRGILQDQIFADAVATTGDLALDEFDEPADAVLFMHHGIAGQQLQRVHGVPPLGRHAPHVLGGAGGGPSQQVSFGQQPQFETVQDKTAPDGGSGHLDDARLRLLLQGVHAGTRDVGVVEQFRQALRRARTLRGHHNPPLVPDMGANEVHHLGHIALVPAGFPGMEVQDVDLRQQLLVGGQRRDGPPGDPMLQREAPGFCQGTEAGGMQCCRRLRAEIQRRCSAVGRRGPCCFQELLVGCCQVVCAGADLLRFDDHGN